MLSELIYSNAKYPNALPRAVLLLEKWNEERLSVDIGYKYSIDFNMNSSWKKITLQISLATVT